MWFQMFSSFCIQLVMLFIFKNHKITCRLDFAGRHHSYNFLHFHIIVLLINKGTFYAVHRLHCFKYIFRLSFFKIENVYHLDSPEGIRVTSLWITPPTLQPPLFRVLWTGSLSYAPYKSLSISKLSSKKGGGGGCLCGGVRYEFTTNFWGEAGGERYVMNP
jgi:hypothetical protein